MSQPRLGRLLSVVVLQDAQLSVRELRNAAERASSCLRSTGSNSTLEIVRAALLALAVAVRLDCSRHYYQVAVTMTHVLENIGPLEPPLDALMGAIVKALLRHLEDPSTPARHDTIEADPTVKSGVKVASNRDESESELRRAARVTAASEPIFSAIVSPFLRDRHWAWRYLWRAYARCRHHEDFDEEWRNAARKYANLLVKSEETDTDRNERIRKRLERLRRELQRKKAQQRLLAQQEKQRQLRVAAEKRRHENASAESSESRVPRLSDDLVDLLSKQAKKMHERHVNMTNRLALHVEIVDHAHDTSEQQNESDDNEHSEDDDEDNAHMADRHTEADFRPVVSRRRRRLLRRVRKASPLSTPSTVTGDTHGDMTYSDEDDVLLSTEETSNLEFDDVENMVVRPPPCGVLGHLILSEAKPETQEIPYSPRSVPRRTPGFRPPVFTLEKDGRTLAQIVKQSAHSNRRTDNLGGRSDRLSNLDEEVDGFLNDGSVEFPFI
ncbi:MAG: hypothetical protein MHM6MM_002366 [Cercozoa sp. M6MM]